MSNKEVEEYIKRLDEGLALAEKEMLQDKASRNESIVYSDSHGHIKRALAKGYNVMIVLLEGWHPYYVDGLSGQDFGATPVFDDILKNGVNFTNAYAAGLRSIFGFAAVFAGVPLVPGLPMFGYGLELTAFSPMPKHFARAGYYTFFAQTRRIGIGKVHAVL